MVRFKLNPITQKFNVVNDSIDLGATFTGPYAGGAVYTIGQGVSSDGKLYICLAGTTGNPPPNPLYWDELELQGPAGPQGATGPTGPASDSALSFMAGESLVSHRMVTLNASSQVIHADHTEIDHAGKIIGLTLGSAVADAEITVCSFGLVTEASWSWDITKPNIFLSTTGQITQTPPTSGFACVIGYAVSATQLFVRIQPSTILINPS